MENDKLEEIKLPKNIYIDISGAEKVDILESRLKHPDYDVMLIHSCIEDELDAFKSLMVIDSDEQIIYFEEDMRKDAISLKDYLDDRY